MIIGIDGYAGAGKDTCAKSLLRYGFITIYFADALRDACSQTFNIPINEFTDRSIKDREYDTPRLLRKEDLDRFCDIVGFSDKRDLTHKYVGHKLVSHRNILKFMGTEIGRNLLLNSIWIDKYLDTIKDKGLVVTPDARFSDERELIKSLGGVNMWVSNPRITPDKSHISETDKWELDKYDIIVNNDGEIASVYCDVGLWWIYFDKHRNYRL